MGEQGAWGDAGVGAGGGGSGAGGGRCGRGADPGRTMRSQAMASRAVKPWCRIIHSPMSVPVRPRPARQCTATTPSPAASHASMKRSTMSSGGTCPAAMRHNGEE